MFSQLKNVFERFKSKWKLDDSPISTINKRLNVIEKTLSVFGWNTQKEKWRPGIMTIASTLLIFSSLSMDVRKASYMIENRDQENVQDIVETLVFIVTQSVCSYRIYVVIRYRREQRAIIKKLTVDYCEWLTTEKKQKVMSKVSRNGWLIFKLDMLVLSMTTIFFLSRSLKDHTLPLTTSGFVLPHFDSQETPYYEILYFLHTWIVTGQIGMALAMNNLFCALAVMICSHLECLTVDIDELEETNSEQKRKAILEDIIKKHIEIFEVVTEVNRLYGTVLGLQPLYTGAVIITSTLLYDGSEKSNVFLQITFDHIFELFIYCYIGDLVSVKSLAIGQRLYSCNWMDMNSCHKKTMLQIMHRCQKPFTINAGIFGPLTMEMYSKSMQMTYSMWTVFKGKKKLNI